MSRSLSEVQSQLTQDTQYLRQQIAQFANQTAGTLNEIHQLDLQTIIDSSMAFQGKVDALPNLTGITSNEDLRIIRHDLRNVLNLMIGFAFVLHRDIASTLTPDQLQLLQQIHLDSKSLVDIVNEIQ